MPSPKLKPEIKKGDNTKQLKGVKGEFEVYSGAKLFSKGKWIRVRVVLVGTKLQLKSMNKSDQYDKTLQISEITGCSATNLHGRKNCLVLTGFNRAPGTKRIFDCLSVEARNAWQKALTKAAISSPKSSSPNLKTKNFNGPTGVAPPPPPVKSMRHASYVRQKKKSLESFMLWHEEWRRTPEFKACSKAQRRWWAAMYIVARDVYRIREERYGYSSLELIKLQKKLTDIDTYTISEIKRKARRILRRFVQESKKNSSKFGDIVIEGAKKRGIAVESEKSISSRQHNRSSKGYLDSGFRKQLQTLLRKEKVLPKLTRTLELIRRKERHQFVLSDAMRGLWVARCVRALLNLPGGLAAVLAMPQERGSLRRLLAAALLCRVPILTTLVLEMLAALLLLPTQEGKAVVHNVLAQIDRCAKWGHPLCSDYLLRPSAEALKWSSVGSRSPPPFVALATLLNDTPEHNCCPELRSAVVTLFAALCRSESTRSAAQWTQAKIFHACRGGITPPKMSLRSCETLLESEAMERARRRRNSIGYERGADDNYGDTYDDDLHPCPPLLALLESERKQGYGDSETEEDKEVEDINQLFRIQLENFLDGWDKRELDEADEIDSLAIGTAERIELLSERLRRSMLLLGRYTNVDDALHAFTLDLEHGAFMPIAKLVPHTIINDDGEEGGRHIRLNMNETLNAICRLHLNHTISGSGVASLVAMAGQSVGTPNDGRRTDFGTPRALHLSKSASSFSDSPKGRRPSRRLFGPPLKDDPRFTSYIRMIKLHVPRIAIEAKMVQDGLDPSILDLDPNEPAPDVMIDDHTTDDTASLASDVTTLENDVTYAKYFKMLRLHVPRGAIVQKMEAEGLDPSVLDFDPSQSVSRAIGRDGPTNSSQDMEDGSSTVMLHENTETIDEHDLVESAPLGCQRAPRQKLRKVFWDVVIDPAGTVWESILTSPEYSSTEPGSEYPLTETALDELELVFGIAARKTDVSKADRSAEAASQQMRKFESAMTQAAAGAPAENNGKSQSIVAKALGEKRAFALNLLYGSLRISNDECVATIAALDPTNTEFVEKLPRLGTLYNMISRKEDLNIIEHALIDAGIFDETTKSLVSGADTSKFDGLSRLMIGLLERARRPRAKVQALWLYATVKDRAAELFSAMKNYEKVTDAILSSNAFRKLLSVVLSITNFVNCGSDLGNNAGVRISALNKLHTTRTTTSDIGNMKNLLQFVVKHSGVTSSQLKHDIPLELLRNMHSGSPREVIHSGIDQLRSERDDAVAERGVLSREATAQGVDARRVAVAAAAAARMAHIVADVDDELAGLDAAFSKMDNTVDAMLRYFGEPNAASCDVANWLRSLETFITHYDAEYIEYREQVTRREKRNTLARKQREREQHFQIDEPSSPKNHSQPSSPKTNINRNGAPSSNPGRMSQRFDRLIDDVARGLVDSTDQNEHLNVHICAQCGNCNSSTTPGAFTNDGSENWYCVDCWYDFSFANPTSWRDDFGEETTPIVNNE